MPMSEEREKDKKARNLICKALRECYGPSPRLPEFRDKQIPIEQYHEELTERGIEYGILALMLINNMAEGSGQGEQYCEGQGRYAD